MKVLYLMSGDYGAGKTFLANSVTSATSVVALASPIRTDLFRLFLDTRIHATDQETKNSKMGEEVIQKALNKNKVSKVSKPVLDRFHQAIDGKNLTELTVRDMLILWGNAGRDYNKNYWIKRTCKILGEIDSDTLVVDDVRFMNEKRELIKWATKNGYSVLHYYIGDMDTNYNNQELYFDSDYRLQWGWGNADVL